MGLLGLLFGGMVAGSAVKCAAEDSYFKQQYSTFPNGVKFWIDRKGTARLMDGTIIINPAGDVVEDIHGRVIYNRLAGLKEKEVEEEKEVARKYGRTAYSINGSGGVHGRKTIELSTGRQIEYLAFDRKNQKFAKKYKGEPVWHMITQDEANKLNAIRGGHYITDHDEIRRKYPFAREDTNWWEEPAWSPDDCLKR